MRRDISTASAAAEAPSYTPALETSMPASWQIKRLIFEQRLQGALAHLRLIRRVRGGKTRSGKPIASTALGMK